MESPAFPYISQIHINDCYASQNFDVPKSPITHFQHIILTGKNGTGKTTILNRIAFQLNEFKNARNKAEGEKYLNGIIQNNKNNPNLSLWKKQLKEYSDIDLFFSSDAGILKEVDKYVFSFFKAHRKVQLQEVTTVSKENQFTDVLRKRERENSDEFGSLFKQYIVNKKVYEAFDFMNKKQASIEQNQAFFTKLTEILQRVFEDRNLELEFVQENFEFFIKLTGGRHITFNQLSEGFSAFISILMELMMRVDLMRKTMSDFNLQPYGIVLIDEPETHFHVSMQYEILPLLTELFPKIQFIIATHSPAIISSIKDSVVFDLTSKKEVSGWQAGSSYSELLIKHFGLENEFSPIADKIILDVNAAVQEGNIQKLQGILAENEKFLTPSLKFEIENQIIALVARKK